LVGDGPAGQSLTVQTKNLLIQPRTPFSTSTLLLGPWCGSGRGRRALVLSTNLRACRTRLRAADCVRCCLHVGLMPVHRAFQGVAQIAE
jgi:hypothetical protein